jgi:hypothetical protein
MLELTGRVLAHSAPTRGNTSLPVKEEGRGGVFQLHNQPPETYDLKQFFLLLMNLHFNQYSTARTQSILFHSTSEPPLDDSNGWGAGQELLYMKSQALFMPSSLPKVALR